MIRTPDLAAPKESVPLAGLTNTDWYSLNGGPRPSGNNGYHRPDVLAGVGCWGLDARD